FQIPTEPQDPDARPLACVASIGIPLALKGQSRIIAVRNGVTLDSRLADLGCPGALAVLSGRGLAVEPGTLRVVEDRAWEQWLAYLRAQVRTMVSGILANLMLLEQTDPELVGYIRRRLRPQSSLIS
ncbi:hypothetical protein DYH09_31085, partial [bacterium CPR1]|nr:hypothetical protein [bacterium CPR1]